MLMQEHERSRASQWLREMRGDISQAELAADITSATGWTITRDRYSKYESGSLPFGREVLGHFVDYWAGKGRPGPDFTPPAQPPDLATALLALASELAALREERQAMVQRVDELEAQVAELVEAAPSGAGSASRAARVAPQATTGSGR